MKHFSLAPALLLALLPAASALSAETAARSFDSRFFEARSLALGGKREAALAAYSSLLLESPGNSDVLVGRGRVHAWMEHWAEAEADLLAATKAAPDHADAWSALGDQYLWRGLPKPAADAYSRWIFLAPENGEAWAARGKAYRSLMDMEAARADFRAAAKRGIDARALLASIDSVSTGTESGTPRVGAAAEAEATLSGSRSAESLMPTNYRWSAGLSTDRVHFHQGGSDWVDSVASIRHQGKTGSVGVEVLESQRFGIKDRAFAIDSYAGLWSRAYANARVQIADSGSLFPHNRWRAEIFQGVGTGWELSASYDRLGFSNAVELLSVGAGRYVGNWYIRMLHLYVPGTTSDPSHSNSDRLTTRYYYNGDADHYLELTGGRGRTAATTTTPGSATPSHDSASFGIAWAGLVTSHIGLKFSANHGYGNEGQPSHHEGVSGSVFARW